MLVAVMITAVLGVALAAFFGAQRARFEDQVALEAVELHSLSAQGAPRPLDRTRLEALPATVRRYLDQAIGTRDSAIRTVALEQIGIIRLAPDEGARPIAATQFFTADPPGFVWHGRVHLLPGVWIDARDRSANGSANMLIKAESIITLLESSGKELDEGAAMRVLGEMVWFPTGFLDERYVTWEPIDDDAAKATLHVGGVRVSLTFTFDDSGLPTRIDALRWRDIGGGKSELTPWTAESSDFARADGVLVPHRVRATWHLASGDYEALDLRITNIDYDAVPSR